MFDFSYGTRHFDLKPFTSKTQKDIALMLELLNPSDESTLDQVLHRLKFKNIYLYTFDEKLALIYKMREISVSEELALTCKCPQCGTPQQFDVDIRGMIIPPKEHNPDVIDNYKEFDEKEIKDYTNMDIDEMDLDEYESFKEKIKNSICTFNFNREVTCGACRNKFLINLRDQKICLNSLINESFKSIYRTYNDLIYYSHYTKQDIDSMYPFERDIFKGILLETMKKEAETRKKK